MCKRATTGRGYIYLRGAGEWEMGHSKKKNALKDESKTNHLVFSET